MVEEDIGVELTCRPHQHASALKSITFKNSPETLLINTSKLCFCSQIFRDMNSVSAF